MSESSLALPLIGQGSREPTMELVNGSFDAVDSGIFRAVPSPCFQRSVAAINPDVRNFKAL
jgi:hypothetical protein